LGLDFSNLLNWHYDSTYKDVTYNDITYKDNTYNSKEEVTLLIIDVTYNLGNRHYLYSYLALGLMMIDWAMLG
jgi:hypothetical protein